jgi:hypothetical protein
MATIKNPDEGIVREPEAPGAKIERKPSAVDADPAPANPKTAGAAPDDERPLPDPFAARQSDARPMAGKTPRPTDKPGE